MSNKKNCKRVIIPAVIAALIIPFLVYQDKHLTVTEYSYTSDKLSKNFDGYTIVQLSDLHNSYFGKDNENLIEKVRGLSPDIIVITGDLNYSDHTDISSAIQIISSLSKTAPVYYVTGNHEYYIEDSSLRNELFNDIISSGARYLDNEAIEINKGSDSFLLVGLDDKSLGNSTLKEIISDTDKMTIVLAHEPQYLNKYAESGADLVLTGHAHGGQIRLPFIGALIAPDQGFFPEYTSGKFTSGNTEMIVSRGLGNSIIPIRLFDYPEIVCVRLNSNSES